jgi:hypothetical protein
MAVHRLFRHAAMLIGLLASTAGPVASTPTARVAVNFVAPERYTDAGDRFGAGPGLRVTLAEIRRIIEGAALRAMAPGDDLRVDVLDIDLAGFAHPGLSPVSAPRVVSDVTPPAFRLRYDLRRGGRRIAGGDERVSDMNFLFGARANRSGAFAYEEALLRDWARKRLTPQ